ncbi:hypothetical protein [Chelativorans sp. YIM 93263]|uniref:hypothetical protein n=1 Tax=Chelativorans sp. YIM 93263 TaxID=2906648 RepID=UPI002378EF17|nr:hypothetical protein [Chelativorans sp. YIM 93263]
MNRPAKGISLLLQSAARDHGHGMAASRRPLRPVAIAQDRREIDKVADGNPVIVDNAEMLKAQYVESLRRTRVPVRKAWGNHRNGRTRPSQMPRPLGRQRRSTLLTAPLRAL